LEINPSHPAIKELFNRVKESDDVSEDTKELGIILYEAALINSGYSISNPSMFSKRFFSLYNGALGLNKNAPIEEVEVDLDEEDEDEKEKKDEKKSDEDIDD